MKEKIIESLKKNYSNYGLSREALDAVASILEKSITTEEELESSISIAEPLLKIYQKESDAARNLKTKAEKELAEYKTKHPEVVDPKPTDTTPKDPEPPKPDENMVKLMSQMAEMQKRLADADRKVLIGEINKKLDAAMKAKGCVNDAVRNIILGKVNIADDATIEVADKLAESCVNDYNEMCKSLYGDTPIPNQGGSYNPQEYKQGMFAGAISRAEQSGILPAEQK